MSLFVCQSSPILEKDDLEQYDYYEESKLNSQDRIVIVINITQKCYFSTGTDQPITLIMDRLAKDIQTTLIAC